MNWSCQKQKPFSLKKSLHQGVMFSVKHGLPCRVSTSRNTKKIEENFPYTPLSSSVYSRHSVILVQYFSLSIFFWYLYLTYPPPYKKNQCYLAYYVVYTLHVSLYRRALGITTVVDWRRVKDRGVERNFKMFSGFQCLK